MLLQKKSASPLNLCTYNFALCQIHTCLVLRPKLSPIKRALKVNELKIVRMYIKFRYFEKNSKNNLTICFEDWKVNEKDAFKFCGLLTISELYCFQSIYADRDKRKIPFEI